MLAAPGNPTFFDAGVGEPCCLNERRSIGPSPGTLALMDMGVDTESARSIVRKRAVNSGDPRREVASSGGVGCGVPFEGEVALQLGVERLPGDTPKRLDRGWWPTRRKCSPVACDSQPGDLPRCESVGVS